MAPNAIGIAGRYWMTAVWIFCGGGFLWFALFDGVFATIIGLLYRRLLRIQLMSHPLGVHSWPKPPSIRSTSRSEWPSPNRQSLMLSKLFRASSLPYHQAK